MPDHPTLLPREFIQATPLQEGIELISIPIKKSFSKKL